jgi:hypothetical protein
MGGVFSAPFAKLLVLQLAFNRLFILAGIIIPPLADGALQSYQIFRMF